MYRYNVEGNAIKTVINTVCDSEGIDSFSFVCNFRDYQELKQCEDKQMEIIENKLGRHHFNFDYNSLRNEHVLTIVKIKET